MSMKILCTPTKSASDFGEYNPIRKWKIEPKIYEPEKFLYKTWFELNSEDTKRNYGVSFLLGTLFTAEFTSKKEAEIFSVIDKLIS